MLVAGEVEYPVDPAVGIEVPHERPHGVDLADPLRRPAAMDVDHVLVVGLHEQRFGLESALAELGEEGGNLLRAAFGARQRTVPRDRLEAIRRALREEAAAMLDRPTVDVSDLDAAVDAARDGFARLPWAASRRWRPVRP